MLHRVEDNGEENTDPKQAAIEKSKTLHASDKARLRPYDRKTENHRGKLNTRGRQSWQKNLGGVAALHKDRSLAQEADTIIA